MSKITQTQKTRHNDWLLGGNPRAIENQEAEGQQELVESSALPARINSPSSSLNASECYIKMGILMDEERNEKEKDPLFIYVILPIGWKVEATSHSMWSHLLDEKGQTRAHIFYKAAFYDRDAFTNLISRYQYTTEFVSLEAGSNNFDQYAVVKDNATDKRLFQSLSYSNYDRGMEYRQQAKDYLEKNFPDHADFTAYW